MLERYFPIPNAESAEHVPEVDAKDLTGPVFRDRYLLPGVPVVIRGAVRHWPCMTSWRDGGYLRERAGTDEISTYCEGKEPVVMPISSYLDRLDEGAKIYMGPNANRLPEQMYSDLGQLPFHEHMNPVVLAWLIGRESYTQTHEHNGLDVFMFQIVGTKVCCIHEPTRHNDRALYASKDGDWRHSPVDFRAPDLEKYSRFAANRPMYARVDEGDALFFPDPWWHAVRALDDGMHVTVAFSLEKVGIDVWAPSTWWGLRRKLHQIVHAQSGRKAKVALSLRLAGSTTRKLVSRATLRRSARPFRRSFVGPAAKAH